MKQYQTPVFLALTCDAADVLTASGITEVVEIPGNELPIVWRGRG